jgi:hypothetical protein
MQVQPGVTRPDPLVAGLVTKTTPPRVWALKVLDADSANDEPDPTSPPASRWHDPEARWVAMPDVECLEAGESMGLGDGGGLPTFRFRSRGGRMIRPGGSLRAWRPDDLRGHFVKVSWVVGTRAERRPSLSGVGANTVPVPLEKHLYAVVPASAHTIGGRPADSTDPADRHIDVEMLGYPAEWLWTQQIVRQSILWDSTTTAIFQDLAVPFNPLGARSRRVGNRSDDRVTLPGGAGELHVLTSPNRPASERTDWTLADLLEYLHVLMVARAPVWENRLPFQIELDVQTAPAAADGVLDALFKIMPQGLMLHGRSLYSALSAVLSPARGLGWTLDWEGEGLMTAGPHLRPCATFLAPVRPPETDELLLPKADLTAAIDLTDRLDVDRLHLQRPDTDTITHVTVEGEPILYALTVIGGLTLGPAWTIADVDAYVARYQSVDPSHASYDKARAAEAWPDSPAFRDLQIDWTGETLPGPNAVGVFDDTVVNTPANDWTVLEPFLPVEEAGTEGDLDREPVYRPLLVLARTEGAEAGEWFDLMRHQNPTLPRGSQVVLYRDRAHVGIQINPPHTLNVAADAARRFPDEVALPGDEPRITRAEDLAMTLAVRGKTRLRYEQVLRPGLDGRELVVPVPDAQVWLLHKDAPIGVAPFDLDETPTLQVYEGDAQLVTQTNGVSTWYLMRNDMPKLLRVMAVVRSWLAQNPTEASLMVFGWAEAQLPLGAVLTHVQEGTERTELNSLIATKRYDFLGRRMILRAMSPAPDFASFATV